MHTHTHTQVVFIEMRAHTHTRQPLFKNICTHIYSDIQIFMDTDIYANSCNYVDVHLCKYYMS